MRNLRVQKGIKTGRSKNNKRTNKVPLYMRQKKGKNFYEEQVKPFTIDSTIQNNHTSCNRKKDSNKRIKSKVSRNMANPQHISTWFDSCHV
jgi:hypothetical protein